MTVDDVLTLVTPHPPSAPRPELEDRIAAALAADAAPVSSADWLERCGDDAFAVLLALLGRDTLATEALEEVALRVLRDEQPELALRAVAQETLALQAKAGQASRPILGELTPEAQVTLLSAAGDVASAVAELSRAVEDRLEGDCRAEAPRLAAAAVGLSEAGPSTHPVTCEPCALAAARLDAALELSFARAPDLKATAQRAAARLDRERAHNERVAQLHVRVSMCCSFCHDGLVREEAVFCASCLAPHHDDCFREHGRCSAIGCEETETVQARPAEPRARASTPTRRLARRLPWIGLGGLVSAAAFGAYMVQKDRRTHETMRTLMKTPATQPPRAQPTDQVEVLLWEQIRVAKAAKDYATWHRLGVELWHRRPNSPYVARLELPLPIMSNGSSEQIYVNDIEQGTAPAGRILLATYAPRRQVTVEGRRGGQRLWSKTIKGHVYQRSLQLPPQRLTPSGAVLYGEFHRYEPATQKVIFRDLGPYALAPAFARDPVRVKALAALQRGTQVRLVIENGKLVDVTPR